MAQPHEKKEEVGLLVRKGFELLTNGLAPLLDRIMSRRLGAENWLDALCQDEAALTKFGDRGDPPEKFDPAFQLKLLLDREYVNLQDELGHRGLALCRQLRDDRNDWYHHKSSVSGPPDAFVALYHIEKLLLLVGADMQARQVADLRCQVVQKMAHQLDGEVNHPMHAASHTQQASESDHTVLAPSEPGDEFDPNSDEHLIWLLEWSGFELRVEDIKLLGLEDGQRRRIVDRLNDLSMRYDDAVEEAIYHPWKSVERLKSSFRKAAAEIFRSELPARRILACALASKRLAVALEIEM